MGHNSESYMYIFGVCPFLTKKWSLQGGHMLWKIGKTGKMTEKILCREKSGNLKFCQKSGNYQGILQKWIERNLNTVLSNMRL